MATKFPASLPGLSIYGESYKPVSALIATSLQSGQDIQRRRFTQTPVIVKGTFKLTEEEWAIFDGFYRYDAKQGAEPFLMMIDNPKGYTEELVRFHEMTPDARKNSLLRNVGVVLQILEQPSIREDVYRVLSKVSSVQKFAQASNAFSFFIQKTLPEELNNK